MQMVEQRTCYLRSAVLSVPLDVDHLPCFAFFTPEKWVNSTETKVVSFQTFPCGLMGFPIILQHLMASKLWACRFEII